MRWAFVVCLSASGLAQDLQPDVPASHETLLEHLNASRGQVRRDLIARYDDHLASSPDDHLAAIERCKFILASIPEDEYFDMRMDDADGLGCADALEARYGPLPAVVLYRLGTLWGDEAVVYGDARLEDAGIAWTDAQRAATLGLIAEQHRVMGRLREASRLAQRAWEHDRTYDRSVLLADHLRSIGQRQAAIDLLAPSLPDDRDGARLVRKAELLLDLDAPAFALTAMQAAAAEGAYIDPLLKGRVLERAGDTEGARAVYADPSAVWSRRDALTRLFYLDLAQHDRDRAVASYRALRDLGWDADPLGRHRVALALRHAGAPWAADDLAGTMAFFALVILAALAPAGFVLPVHYVGLARRARGAPEVHSRWTLRHAWAACSLVLVGGLVALYAFAYEELATLFDVYGEASHTQFELARAGVLSFTLLALSAVTFARRHDWRGLVPTAWLNRATLGTALKYLLLLLLLAALFRVLGAAFGGDVTSGEGIALSTEAVLRAMHSTYGAGIVLLFAVLIVPLAEEFLFRGVMLEGLARHLSFGWANLVQAGVFALLHDSLSMVPHVLALGLITGMLRRRTGSLAAGTALHAMNNLLASISLLA